MVKKYLFVSRLIFHEAVTATCSAFGKQTRSPKIKNVFVLKYDFPPNVQEQINSVACRTAEPTLISEVSLTETRVIVTVGRTAPEGQGDKSKYKKVD